MIEDPEMPLHPEIKDYFLDKCSLSLEFVLRQKPNSVQQNNSNTKFTDIQQSKSVMDKDLL